MTKNCNPNIPGKYPANPGPVKIYAGNNLPLKVKETLPVIKSLIPAFIWLIIITFLSTRATVPMPKFDLLASDKLGHAAAYGILSWLILWGIRRSLRDNVLRATHIWGVFLFATAFGILMEFVQFTFFPGRFYEIDDMLANAIGAAVACFVWAIPSLKSFRH